MPERWERREVSPKTIPADQARHREEEPRQRPGELLNWESGKPRQLQFEGRERVSKREISRMF